jgi:hypothetical protein
MHDMKQTNIEHLFFNVESFHVGSGPGLVTLYTRLNKRADNLGPEGRQDEKLKSSFIVQFDRMMFR